MTKQLLMAIPIIIILAGAGYYFFGLKTSKNYEQKTLTLGGQAFRVDIADTIAKEAQGLSGRSELAENEGMFFVFATSSPRTFWMKGMNFPIDIIWIKDDIVVGMAENAQPEPEKTFIELKLYSSPQWVNRVLEVPAGTVERLGVKAGDKIVIE